MKTQMVLRLLGTVGSIALMASSAQAAGFVNGDFETGDASGWTQNGGRRTNLTNGQIASTLLTGVNNPDGGRGSIIAAGTVDPRVGAALGSTVYSGKYSYRVEDTTIGGFATVLSQRVNNYTDPNIFFAWKAVLLGAHGPSDAATMVIKLQDLTTGLDVISRIYNAGGGVDARFSSDGSNFYTANWQIENLAIGAGLMGHDFLLSVLGSDCQPTGHWGYVYLDGFGAVAPPPGGVPEPATWAMMLMGFGAIGMTLRGRKTVAA